MPVAEKKKRRSPDKTITDHVSDYMHEHYKSFTVDTLLTRPLDAMRMGLAVAAISGKVTGAEAKRVAGILEELSGFPQAMDAIDDVCRAALNGRKHGDIKRDRY